MSQCSLTDLIDRLKRFSSRQLTGDHFNQLESLIDHHTGPLPLSLGSLLQRTTDQFSQIPEMCRTDFLSCLISYSHRSDSEERIDLSRLQSFLDRLEIWDLELAFYALTFEQEESRLKTVRTYCEHQDSMIAEAASRAMARSRVSLAEAV